MPASYTWPLIAPSSTAQSATTIADTALARVGSTRRLATPSDTSPEGKLCALFYATTRDRLLSLREWSFASRVAALTLAEGVTPIDGWAFAYELPVDCLVARRLFTGDRNPSASAKVPFALQAAEAGGVRLLLTDAEELPLAYTALVSEALFPASFADALAWALAYDLAVPLAAKPEAFARAAQMARIALSYAEAQDANEGQRDLEPASDLLAARGGGR